MTGPQVPFRREGLLTGLRFDRDPVFGGDETPSFPKRLITTAVM
jgi:hypothetical protein